MSARLPKIRLLRLALAALFALSTAGVSPLASAANATPKNNKSSASSQSRSGKSSAARSSAAGKKAAKGGQKKGAKSARSAAAQASRGGKARACYETVVKKGKKHRVKVPCGEAAEPVLSKSPIGAKALEQSGQPLDNSPVKARTAPVRAYAVDGTTFFHNGRKFRIEGLDTDSGAELTHEHAAQKLQKILDSGTVTTEAIGPDDSGAMRAIVRVDGRDVSQLMKQMP